MEEIIYSHNNNSTISCYSMDFSGNSKQNAHSGRNVMPRCLSEGVDIFLKSVERQGESGHDVRVSRFAPWMARVGGPVMMRTVISLFVENSHLETRHQGVMFRSPWAFVGFTTTLRYEPCTQFINVSQRTLHIYWQFSAMSHAIHKIVSKRRCQSYFISRRSPHHGKSKNRDL